MENLFIEGTKTKPKINFDLDTGILEIAGESYPENALEFFKPIYEWLSVFFSEYKNPVIFNFKLTYFNTSSSKAILDLLDLIEQNFKKGLKIEVNWYFEEDDEDIEESGEEFADGLTVPYKLVSY